MQKQRLILIISMGLLTSIMTLCVAIEPTEATIDAREFTGKDGEKLLYRVFKPANYDPGKKYPLVLCLHGGGGKGTDNKSRGTQAFIALSDPEVQKDYPAFLVTPQCPPEGSWAPRGPDGEYSSEKLPMSRETTLVLEILDSLQKEFSIDPARLYVSGQSMGGRGTWDIIQRRPYMFAAAVPVCGSGDPSQAKRIAHMPIWNFHGSEDGVVPVQGSRDMVAALKKEGSKVIYSELEGVNHGSWIPAWETKELIPWLFEQRNPNPGKAQSRIRPGQQAERQGQRRREPGARGPRGRGQNVSFSLTADDFEADSIVSPSDSVDVLRYRYMTPLDYQPGESYPIVLFLHGGGERENPDNPNAINKSQINGQPAWANAFGDPAARQKYPAFLIAPQSPARPLSHSATTDELRLVLQKFIDNYNIDMDRIYVTGLSMGGAGTNAMLKAFPDFFAAGAPVCGRWSERENPYIPMWFFHGDQDNVIPTSESRTGVTALRAAGDTPILYTEYPGVNHGSWNNAYAEPDLLLWMYAQNKSGGQAPSFPTNISVTPTNNNTRATITWDMAEDPDNPIMYYHVYKGDVRLTIGTFDLTGDDGSGTDKFTRVQSYTDNTYSPGDEYTVTAVNYRNQESGSRGQNVSEDWVELHEPHVYNEMLYRVMKPINFDSSRSYPVIVSLHGAGGRGTDNLKQLRDWNEVLAEKQRRTDYPAYVVAPQSERRWDTTHLQNVKDIIKDLPSVDMNRIYVLGHSMGGSGTYRFIQADPNYFAAAAISAGGGTNVDASVIKDLPVWIFYGDQDRIEGGRIIFKKMQEIGGNMKFTTWVGDGHGVAPKMITGADNGTIQLSGDRCDLESVFLKWLFKQRNPNHGKAQSRIRPGQQAQRQGQRRRGPGARGPGGRGQGENPVREGWSNGTIPNPDGGVLDYQLCNPPQLEPNEKYPVILSMGGTSAARSLYYPDDWRRYPAYVVINI